MALNSTPVNPIRRFLPLMMVCIMVIGISSCTKVPRERTLPPSIRSVAIPMIINRSAEVGIEEDATLFVQREFLADGRLNLTSEDHADAIIFITIKRFNDRVVDLGDGRFPRQVELDMVADVYVVRNVAEWPRLGPNRQVNSRSVGRVDARRTTFEPEPLRRERLMRAFAREVVQEVLTGDMAKPEYLQEREQREQQQTEEAPPRFL